MCQGRRRMMLGDPPPVRVEDLVVEPHERPPGRPSHQRRRLPVDPDRRLLVADLHNRQHRQTEPRAEHLVGLGHPARGPDERTSERPQPFAVERIEPLQQRVATRPAPDPGCERQQRPIDIEEQKSLAQMPPIVPRGARPDAPGGGCLSAAAPPGPNRERPRPVGGDPPRGAVHPISAMTSTTAGLGARDGGPRQSSGRHPSGRPPQWPRQ
jgi:hypothetical protein